MYTYDSNKKETNAQRCLQLSLYNNRTIIVLTRLRLTNNKISIYFFFINA